MNYGCRWPISSASQVLEKFLSFLVRKCFFWRENDILNYHEVIWHECWDQPSEFRRSGRHLWLNKLKLKVEVCMHRWWGDITFFHIMFYIFRLGGLLTQGNSNIEEKFMCFSFSTKLFGSWAFIVACVAAFCSVFVHVYDILTLLT